MLRSPLPYSFLPVTAALATALAIGCGADPSQEPQRALTSEVSATGKIDNEPIRTIDHYVHHVSTVDANYGKHVKLFVREKVRRACTFNNADFLVPHVSTAPANAGETVQSFVRERGVSCGPAVLMITGSTQPAMAPFDLEFENYSWMDFLANAGFDVFAMDLTGYGLSPRPTMDDPCNASQAEQTLLLIPNPLSTTCPASYPFRLVTSQSEWDEIDTVVEHLRRLRHVDRVNLVGWSLGAPRVGGYTARHPDKVDKIFVYAPFYDRLEPNQPPAALPEPGVPMLVRTIASFFSGWDTQVGCRNQFASGVRDALKSTILDFDPIGSEWGTQELWRAPNSSSRWGWNVASAGAIRAPTLIIRGDLDKTVLETPTRDLYADLGSTDKVFVHVACAAHQMVWENQHMALLKASREWLSTGRFGGSTTGSFSVDTNGVIHHDP